MKIKKIIITVFVLMTIIFTGLLLYLYFDKNVKTNEQEQPASSNDVAVHTPKKEELEVPKTDPVTYLNELMDSINQTPRLKAMYEMGKASNLDVEFYGRVIDQGGNPVSNATVSIELLRWRVLDASGEHHRFTTDSEGYFVIDNVSGSMFTIRSIEKENYEIMGKEQKSQVFRGVPRNDGFTEIHLWGETSKAKPWVFRAWKRTEAEPLVTSEKFLWLEPDSRSYSIDLTRGKGSTVENGSIGDLKVSFTRPLDAKENEKFSWSVTIEAMGGGIFETSDAFMNEAPEEGYKGSWQIRFTKDSPDYQSRVNKKFYVKSKGGNHYSRIEVELIPHYRTHSAMGIKYWLNPNGSRNLQYDPSKRIYPK